MLKKRMVARSEGVELPDVRKLQSLKEGGEVHKYLGLLEADYIKQESMIKRLSKKIHKNCQESTKVDNVKGGNIMQALNTWAVSLLRYSDDVVSCTRRELMIFHGKTRKLLTIHGALHSRANVSRLYISRNQGVRGLISVVDCVRRLKYNLDSYLSQRKKRLLKSAWKRTIKELKHPADLRESNMKNG